MSASPPMIQFSFQQKLYKIRLPYVPNDYQPFHVTTPSTIDVPAPKILQQEDTDGLRELASKVLIGLKERGNNMNRRLRERIPQHEGAHQAETEADLSDMARLNLVHGVNVVVHELLNQIPNNKGGRLECRREQTLLPSSRPDMMWVWVDKDGGETHIAILEFKRTCTLRYDDFKPAIMPSDFDAREALNYLSSNGEETLLEENNGYWVSKQTKKYHQQAAIADVAVFDWNNMVIFDFSDVSETNNNKLRATRFMWFSEQNKTNQDCQNYKTFRTMLLGFLLRALRRHKLDT